MYGPEINRGDQELDRFDLEVSLVSEIQLERERQKTGRLWLFTLMILALVAAIIFGGAYALGNDGLVQLNQFMGHLNELMDKFL